MYDNKVETGYYNQRAGNGGILAGQGPQIAPPPSGRVAGTLQATVKLTEAIGMEISAIEGRLSTILRPAGPSGADSLGGGASTNTAPSPLAEGIDQLNGRLANALSYLQSISARIDL